MVSGPPRSICCLKIGTTLPRLPSTLPNRTTTNARSCVRAARCTICSATRLLAPMMLPGETALSDEISTKRAVPTRTAASRRRAVPMMLFVTASSGFASMSGTCLCAAAWKTTAGRTRSNSSRIRPPSRMSAMTDCRSSPGNTRRSSASMSKMLFSPWPDEHEAARLRHRDLTAELRADRAARARDEHDLIDDVVEDRMLVPHRLAFQEVGDLDVAQPPDGDPIAEELVDPRQNLRRHVQPAAGFRQHADRAAGRRRHRDHDLLDAVGRHDALERVHRTEHGQAGDPLAVLHDGIVEKADDVQAELRIALRLAGDHGARAASAHDQHALPRGRAGIAALYAGARATRRTRGRRTARRR